MGGGRDFFTNLTRNYLGVPEPQSASASKYDALFDKYGEKHGVDPDFLRSMTAQESTFNPKAVSNKNAQGLMQLIPDTAKRFGVTDSFDPDQNIEGGTKYIKWLLDRYQGDVPKALAGYNAGEGAVDKYKGIPPYRETQDYVKKITGNYKGAGYFKANPFASLAKEYLNKPQDPTASLAQNYLASPPANNIVSESPATIQAQAMSALNPNQTERVAILLKPEEVTQLGDSAISQFIPLPQADGRTLFVAKQSGRKLGLKTPKDVEKHIKENGGYHKLIGKVENIEDTSQGPTIATIAPDGTELTSSRVNSQEALHAQMATDQIIHPNSQSQLVNTQDVVTKRLDEADDLTMLEQGHVLPPQPTLATSQPVKQAQKRPVTPKSGTVSVEVGELTPELDDSRAAEVPNTWKAGDKAKSDDDILKGDETVKVNLKGVAPKDRSAVAMNQAVSYLTKKYGGTPEAAQAFLSREKFEEGDVSSNAGDEISITFDRDAIADLAGGRESVIKKYREQESENILPLYEQARDTMLAKKADEIPDVTLKAAITPEDLQSALVTLGQSAGSEIGVKGGIIGALAGDLAGSAVGGALGSSGRIAGTIGGILDFINDLSPTKGESMAQALDPHVRVARPDDSFRDILKDVEEAGEQAEARMGDKGIVSQIFKVAGATPGDLSRLILISRLPGGMISGMALDSAAQTKSKGGDTKEILKSAGHGATLGALFHFAPTVGKGIETSIATLFNKAGSNLIKESATLATIGGGTYTMARATGSDSETAFREAVVNSAFHLTNVAPKLIGKAIRVRDEQGNVATVKVENGEVKPVNEEPVAEVFVPAKVVKEIKLDNEVKKPAETKKTKEREVSPVDKTIDENDPSTFDHGFEIGSTVKFKREFGVKGEKSEIAEGRVHNIGLTSEGKPMYGITFTDAKGNQRTTTVAESNIKTKPTITTEQHLRTEIADDLKPFVDNKIFKADKVAEIRERLAKKSTQLNAGIDPKDLADFAYLGGAHIEAGARTFAKFAKAMADDGIDLAETELRKIYDRVRDENKFEGMEAKPIDGDRGASRVGQNIEAKAIEKGLTTAFDETVGYDKITIREQAEKTAKLLEDPERVKNIIAGTEQLPSDIRGGSFIKAVEDRAFAEGDVQTLQNLAKSKLTSDTSIAAQELRVLRERDPNSPVAKIQEITKVREESATKRGTKAPVEKQIAELEAKLAEHETKLSEMRARAEVAEAKAEAKESSPIADAADKLVARAEKRAVAARERLAQRGNVFTSGLDPLALKDLGEIGVYHILKGARDFTKFSGKMIEEFGDKIKPHLQRIFDSASKSIETNTQDRLVKAAETRLKNQIEKLQKEIDSKTLTSRDTKESITSPKIEELKTERDKLKAEHKEIFPQVSKQMTVEMKQSLYKKNLEKQIAQIEKQIATGEKPVKGQRIPTTKEIDILKAKRDALKARLPEVERKLTNAQKLKMREGSLNKRITELDEAIKNQTRITREKKAALTSPKVQELMDKRDALKSDYDSIFPKEGVTNEQRLAAFKARAEKRIEDLESGTVRNKPAPVVLDAEGLRLQTQIDLLKSKVGVTDNEASIIMDLSKQIQTTREAREKGGDRLEYGRAVTALNNYVSDLKIDAERTTFNDVRRRPVQSLAKTVVRAPGFFKALQSAFDNSAVFRQGWKTMWSHPGIWQRNARKTFVDIYNTFGGKPVADELQADIVSRPNYDLYKKAKLDVGTQEEAFPTTLPGKIPFIRRAYKASENAYTGFLHKTRADVFDKLINVAERNGVELDTQELVNIGRLVNALTGRGNLGKLERAGEIVNVTFFSPRNFKAHIDTLTQPLLGGATIGELATGENTGSSFVRKEAAKNLLKTVGGTAAVLVLIKALLPDDDDTIELDPRSANFSKIKIGNSRFDVTGGAGSLFILASRLATGMSKSSTSDKLTNLSEGGFGKQTRLDVIEDFFENKLSPVGQVTRDWLKGERFGGEKFSYGQAGLDLITPLPVKNAIENWKDPKAAPFILTTLADGLGIGSNTYGKKKPKDANSLKERVRAGKITLDEAKQELQKEVDGGKITNAQKKAQLQALTIPSTIEEAKKFRSQTDADFDAMDEFAAELSESDKPAVKTVWQKKLMNLEKDHSPKSQDAADKLRMVMNKHFSGVGAASTLKPLKPLKKLKE